MNVDCAVDSPRFLETVVLRHSQDISAAAWLTASAASPGCLVTFGPAVFEAYARLRYIPDPDQPGMSEADVPLADDHPTDIEQARIVKLSDQIAAADEPDVLPRGRC